MRKSPTGIKGENCDRLNLAVDLDTKIFLFQITHWLALAVLCDHADLHQASGRLEHNRWLIRGEIRRDSLGLLPGNQCGDGCEYDNWSLGATHEAYRSSVIMHPLPGNCGNAWI
jgi:hypothetical protein